MASYWVLSKLARNEAMKMDPHEIYGHRVFFTAISACFGGMSFGWDSSLIAGIVVMPPFRKHFQLSEDSNELMANLTGNIVAMIHAGCLVGALFTYPLADRYGRKPCLIVAGIITLAGVAMQVACGVAHVLFLLYGGRFLSGIGIGICSCASPLYLTENAPRSIRGLLGGMYQLFTVLGGMLAYWTDFALNGFSSGQAMYMIPLGLQAIPSILLCVCMFFCNESPRWMARQDRLTEAKRLLSELRNLDPSHPCLQQEFDDIINQLEHERHLVGSATFWGIQRDIWTIKINRHRAIIIIVLFTCQQLTGTSAINMYAPVIFKAVGFANTSQALLYTGIYGMLKVVGCLLSLSLIVDSLGRRRALLWGALLIATLLYLLGADHFALQHHPGAPNPAESYTAMVAIFVFAVGFQLSWGPACWIVASEIPSPRLRSANVGMAAATHWLICLVVSRTMPNMLAAMQFGTYIMFASSTTLGAIFVFLCIPETRGVSLERMDELFSGGLFGAHRLATLAPIHDAPFTGGEEEKQTTRDEDATVHAEYREQEK